MSDPDSIGQRVKEVARSAVACADSEDAETCERLQLEIGELETEARERFQRVLRPDFMAIADKLERGLALDASERELLERLMSGASRRYVRSETDVGAWREEIGRLARELEALGDAPDSDPDVLIQLQALCRVARRVLPSLTYYLSERDRVARFDESSQAMDLEEGRMLARIIRDMMVASTR